MAATPFISALATGTGWQDTTRNLLTALGDVKHGTLGIVYLTDALAEDASSVLTLLRRMTGIRNWVGTTGMGVIAAGREVFDQPALAAMVLDLPEESFHLLPLYAGQAANSTLPEEVQAWTRSRTPHLGLIHADPAAPQITLAIQALARETGAFLVGGLSSSRGEMTQIAGTAAPGSVTGVLFAPEVEVLTGLSQGCTPIGPPHRISDSEENLLITLDDRPAMDVLKADVGQVLARDLARIAGYIFVGLPREGAEPDDYTVRSIMGMDESHGLIAITDVPEPGRSLIFTRRDRDGAVEDLDRMLAKLTRRLDGRKPRGALYVSCIARGPNLFGDGNREITQVQAHLGPDVPVVGFFANGEISHDRLYGFTGVLTLFL